MRKDILLLCLTFVISSAKAEALYQAQQDTSLKAQQSDQKKSSSQTALAESLKQAEPEWSITTGRIFWSVIILGVGFLIIKYLSRLLETLSERWGKSRLAIKGLIPVVRIMGWIIVVYIIVVDVIAPPIATIVALTASAGIAVGFASQDILKNIFGGILILFDRPFQVGDKIDVAGHYGEVLNIGLRTVRVVTQDDSVVSIPNSEIINQSVSNANSGESNCQVFADFYLPTDIDMSLARKIAIRAAAVSRYVYLNKKISVSFKNEIYEGRSLLKMKVRAYVLDVRHEFPFVSEMTEIVIQEFLKRKLIERTELPFTTGNLSG